MRFDPDKIKVIQAYILSYLPLIVGCYFLFTSQSFFYYHLICFLIFVLLTVKLIKIANQTVSASLIINSRLIYLDGGDNNYRLIWDNVREVYLGQFTWLNISWLIFFSRDKATGPDLSFKMSILSLADQKNLLAYVKGLAKGKSIPINY